MSREQCVIAVWADPTFEACPLKSSWQYWEATGDDAFLRDAGAEILLETGRYWASRALLEADGYRHIRDVIGPDEYHEHVDDNAFTNVMARWNIRRAIDVAALLRERWPECWKSLSTRLGLGDAELNQWRSVVDAIATGLDPNTGLFEQFAGYFALEDIDLADYAGRSVPMDVVLGRERTQGSQVIKQADVVALLGLLPDEFLGETGIANFQYYEPRCGHGSSLSRAMHGLVAARLGYSEMALSYFRQTAAIDLADTHVAIDGGIHIAALGGVWLMAVFGFAGLSLRNDGVAIDPQLPAGWSSLGFGLQWRCRRLKMRIDQAKQCLEATLEKGEPMTLVVSGTSHELRRNQVLRVSVVRPNRSKARQPSSSSPAADHKANSRFLEYGWQPVPTFDSASSIAFWPRCWQVQSKLSHQPFPAAIRRHPMGTMPRYGERSARLLARGGLAPRSATRNR